MKFLADENLRGVLERGLRYQQSNLDIVRVQDVGLSGADDPTVLEWAAQAGRVLITHDAKTITKYAYDRLVLGLEMPGVIEVNDRNAIASRLRTFFCWLNLRKNVEDKFATSPSKQVQALVKHLAFD